MIGIEGQSKKEERQLTYSNVGIEKTTDLEILSDFTNESLERQLPNEKFCGFLVATDFTKSDCSRAETMGFLHTSCCSLQEQKN